jgi:hypothetical protein
VDYSLKRAGCIIPGKIIPGEIIPGEIILRTRAPERSHVEDSCTIVDLSAQQQSCGPMVVNETIDAGACLKQFYPIAPKP